jgi:signal transduction histidine kinase
VTPQDALPAANFAPALEDALIVLNGRGDVVFANPAAATLFAGQSLQTGVDIASRLELAAERPLRFDGLPERVEARLRARAHGGWLEVAAYPIPAGLGAAAARTIVVARDISSRRREGELREAFASVVSHELRTPVTTIYGGAQLLADTSISDRTRQDAATAVVEEAERLYRIIEDLLVLARFDQPIAVVDEPVLLQRFVPVLVAREAARGDIPIRLQLPADLPAVAGGQGYIEQVLRHLLLSAVRFSAPGQAVSVGARRVRNAIEVVVTDSGPAIDAAEAGEMFELFHRSARTLSGASGANLGLFVCRRLVEAMGGRIWARPRRRLGAELGFALKVAEGQD